MKVLVADDSKTNLDLITLSLKKLGHEVMAAESGQTAIELFEKSRPDLIILDVIMDGMDGFECAKKIRAIDESDWIPIIFLSGSVDDESIAKGIDAGGDDYLTKPYSKITLAAKIKAMQRISNMRQQLFEATQKLALLSSTDNLTGINNRMQFDKIFREKIAQADRDKRNLALLFIDIDKFKDINDTYGHHIGDLLLIEIAKRLQSCLRVNDLSARIGGDEFCIIITNQNAKEVGMVAQKIINALAAPYMLESNTIENSASIGIVFYPQDGQDLETLYKNADNAMYQAKKAGRNNYQYASSHSEEMDEGSEIEKGPSRAVISEEALAFRSTDTQKISLLSCLVNKSYFCIELHYIKKTIALSEVQAIPNSPNYFLGSINCSGKSVPIIDLGSRLNIARVEPYSLNTPILLCSDTNGPEVGFIVDEVLGLYEVDSNSLQTQGYNKNPISLIHATVNLNGQTSLLVNIKLLLAIDFNVKQPSKKG